MSFGPFFSQHVQSLPAKTQRARRLQPVREEMNWRWRAVPLALVAAIVVLVLAGRLWQLQVVEGDQNLASSRNNSLSLEMIPAPRGIIYDRDGKILARNEPSFRVTITYSQLPTDNSKRNAMVARLAKLLSMKKEEVELAIDESMMRPFLPAPLKKHVDRDTEIAILAAEDDLPGVTVEQDLQRGYPMPEAFSHILGYTGVINQRDLENPEYSEYELGEEVGQSGIEQVYERYLHGRIGKRFSRVDAQGQVQFSQSEIAPEPGDSLVLAIDAELQKYTYEVLVEAMEKYDTSGAAAVFQDPSTGKILGLVSVPSYDNNLFARGISGSDYTKLLQNPFKPLFNRAIAGTYPPGSTVKPLVVAGAIDEGVIGPDTIVYSPNIIERGGSTFADWTYWLGRSGPGNINAVEAIAQSTDTFFYKIGGGFEQQRGMGVDALYTYYTRAGLGVLTGIDLPGEAKGVVPNPAWKAEQFPDDPGWYVGNTYQLAIGQSYLLSTPLQITAMTSAIANDGMLMRPQIVDRIVDGDDRVVKVFDPEVVANEVASKAGLEVGREGMRVGVEKGIIFPLRNNPFEVAAKTGTAEFGNREVPDAYGTHSWVTGYAPYNSPEISFTLLLDSGGSSTNAAEVANEILTWYYENR